MKCSALQCTAGHRFEVHRLQMTVAVEYQCDSNNDSAVVAEAVAVIVAVSV